MVLGVPGPLSTVKKRERTFPIYSEIPHFVVKTAIMSQRGMGLRFTPHCRRWAAALVIWNELLRSGMQVVLQGENASGELWSMRWTEIGG